MASNTSIHVRYIYVAMLVLGVIPALLVVVPYVWQFASLSGYELSYEDNAWANFGSYVGGLLGVWFAFLAFAGVLLAIWLQMRQLEHTRERAHLDELQRVIFNVASNIDSALSVVPGIIEKLPSQNSLRGENLSVFNLISAGGSAALEVHEDNTKAEANRAILTATKRAIDLHVGPLGIELDHLAWCLDRYDAAGGSPDVVKFYMRRYRPIVCWLDALGYLTGLGRIQAYFKPLEMRSSLNRTYEPR